MIARYKYKWDANANDWILYSKFEATYIYLGYYLEYLTENG